MYPFPESSICLFLVSLHVNNRLRSQSVPKELPTEVTDIPELRTKWHTARILDVIHSKDIDLIKRQLEDSDSVVNFDTFLADYDMTILVLPFLFDDPLFSVTLMEFFLDHGADIDRRGDDGDTVLAAAVEFIGDSLEPCMTGKIELVGS